MPGLNTLFMCNIYLNYTSYCGIRPEGQGRMPLPSNIGEEVAHFLVQNVGLTRQFFSGL